MKHQNFIRLFLLIFLLLLIVIVIFDSAGFHFSDFIKKVTVCPFNAITGKKCPGCGMTSAILALAHLDFKQAFRHNPFSFLIVFLMIFFAINGKLPQLLENKWSKYSLLILVIFFGIYRLITT